MNLNNENFIKQMTPLLVYLFISFILISFSVIRFFDPIFYLADKTTLNIRSNLYSFGVTFNSYFSFITNSKKIVDQNLQLKKDLYNLKSIEAENEVLMEQNKSLKAQLNIPNGSKQNVEMALIISKDNGYISLDKGENEGIRKNDIVVYTNILIGIVTQTLPETSRVELITDKDSAVPINIVGSNVEGILDGSPQSNLTINDILPEENVSNGELVVTSGLGGVFPNGLLIGSIASVQNISSQPYKSANVNPIFDLSETNYLYIVKK